LPPRLGAGERWRIDGALGAFEGNEDQKAFAEWSRDYAKRCAVERHTDAARLADVVAPLLGEAALRKPKLLVAYAFDAMSPQELEFVDACEKRVSRCEAARRRDEAPKCSASPSARRAKSSKPPRSGRARGSRRPCERAAAPGLNTASGSDAAQVARGESEEARPPRIGVVIPELGQRRKEVVRVFARTLHPAHNLPGEERKALPFNVSIGAPLGDYPVVRAALSILEFAAGEIPFEQASRLVRSPFLEAADAEMAKRARLDADLRQVAPARVTLGKLIGLVEGAPVLRQKLEPCSRFRVAKAAGRVGRPACAARRGRRALAARLGAPLHRHPRRHGLSG